MKKWSSLILAAVTALLLGPAVAAGPEAAAFEADQLETLQLMGLDTPDWMVTTTAGLGPIITSFDCSRLNHGSCRYIYEIASGCCIAYRPPPTAFCSRVCL